MSRPIVHLVLTLAVTTLLGAAIDAQEGFPCPDYPVPYVPPYGPPRNLAVRAPDPGWGCFPDPNGLALGRATDGSYVIDLRSRRVVATVTGVGHEPYGLAVVER